jgi:hypothetical protein
MRLANMAFAEMTEALNRGWENRDSRSPALLQLERCGLRVEVDPRRIQEVLIAMRRTMGSEAWVIRMEGLRLHHVHCTKPHPEKEGLSTNLIRIPSGHQPLRRNRYC